MSDGSDGTREDPLHRALLLADRGLAECRSCHRELPLFDLLTSWWHATLVFAACHECLSAGRVVLTRRTERGIEVGFADVRQPSTVTGDAPRLAKLPVGPKSVHKILGG